MQWKKTLFLQAVPPLNLDDIVSEDKMFDEFYALKLLVRKISPEICVELCMYVCEIIQSSKDQRGKWCHFLFPFNIFLLNSHIGKVENYNFMYLFSS